MGLGFFREQIARVDNGGWRYFIRNIFLFLLSPLFLLIVLLVRFLRPVALIKFGELISSRIGHLAGNTEIYLSEKDAGILDRKSLDFFYTNSFVANRQLMKMWKRVLRISPLAAGLDWVNRAIPGGERHRTQPRQHQDRDIHAVLDTTRAHLSFLAQEEEMGRGFLDSLGIKDGAFVCFLARDPAYLGAVLPGFDAHYHDFRDSSIKNFIPAAESLAENGYSLLRMGAAVREPLMTANPRIIDYASGKRTDFLDIYLGAKCSFYLGDSCGFSAVPMIFRRPLAITNMVPLEYAPTWSSNYLFIPKKLWSGREGRFLSFCEILDSGMGRYLRGEEYASAGIETIENTPEEITALALEMHCRLKGDWQPAEEDEELQRRFWRLFRPSGLNKVCRSRIGAEFLRRNKALLTEKVPK